MSWISVNCVVTFTDSDDSYQDQIECIYQFKAEQDQDIMEIVRKLVMEENIRDVSEEKERENKRSKKSYRDINITSIKLISNCWGCRSDQPNQLAHVDLGGCLYDEKDD
ncbi:MAG: hypothetical protein Barrevirus14_10 [Barrevirus sp.]|uniref:Uncharacterized protein n=1 Tax=Barrevirus sp. TaxID=2487763 RepID=A0A3G4ZT12_9VIRU|nr:MAG: hypothetical protein Barrevirus14_10 [Barrevirus sp.]